MVCSNGGNRYMVLRSNSDPCIFIVLHPQCERAFSIRDRSLSFQELVDICEGFVVRGFSFPEDLCPEEAIMEEVCSRPFI